MKLQVEKKIAYSVVKYPKSYQPDLAKISGFKSVTWTADECSVIAKTAQLDLTYATEVENSWRLLQVVGILDFALTGILAQLANPLAAANISIFALSTYNTDYLLVKDQELERSVHLLRQAGHHIELM